MKRYKIKRTSIVIVTLLVLCSFLVLAQNDLNQSPLAVNFSISPTNDSSNQSTSYTNNTTSIMSNHTNTTESIPPGDSNDNTKTNTTDRVNQTQPNPLVHDPTGNQTSNVNNITAPKNNLLTNLLINLTTNLTPHFSTKPTTNLTPRNLPVIHLLNKAGKSIGRHTVIEESDGTHTLEISDKEHKGQFSVSSEAETKIVIQGLKSDVNSNNITARIDEYTKDTPSLKLSTKVVALNDIDMDHATLQIAKSGPVSNIFHCANFSLEEFSCSSWDATDIPFSDKGSYIEFNVTHFSGYAGGEINATEAKHLDRNYTLIADIYPEVEHNDNVWSETIFTDEIIRVTFEKNLANGRVIDVIARSNGTIAYFDIFEEGTDHKVGRSGVVDHQEWQYITISNLTKSADTFDFKIVKATVDPQDVQECINVCQDGCSDDPYPTCGDDCVEECESEASNPRRTAFLEFDYIHDEAINITHADGIVAYEELNLDTPRYRSWNESNDFSPELTDTQDIGADTTWIVLRASHERDEMILGTIDRSNDINIQIYNESKAWGELLEVTQTTENSAYRSLDIAYEDLSGDALIVYEENNSPNNNDFAYRIWNGTGYSSEVTVDTALVNGEMRWFALTPKRGSDEMMLLVHNDIGDLYALPWNGTAFDTSQGFVPSTGTTSNGEQHFAFAWEVSSNEGLVIYGEGSNLVYRTYSPVGGFGSTENTISLGNGLDALRLCSDPQSDYIGIIWQDAGNDVQARMWDGDQILANPPSQDTQTERNGANNINVDCAWYNSSSALFGFIDEGGSGNGYPYIDYVTFTKSNTWSTTDLTNTSTTFTFATDDISSLRFVEHPTTSEIMVIAMDIAEDISAIRWDGVDFVNITSSPLEGSLEVTNGQQEGVMFDWYRYDTPPSVTDINPSGLTYNVSTNITIESNVTDNINVSDVLANVSLPNGTIIQIALSDTNNDSTYNSSFGFTNAPGNYTIRIITNDTSIHQNVNNTQTTTFIIIDTLLPNVTGLLPITNLTINPGDSLEVAANVSDNVGVDSVVANITLPNGSMTQVSLSLAVGEQYNNTYSFPNVTGQFNITLVANDTSNNINSTQTTYFNVVDVQNPGIISALPVANSIFNVSDTIEIAANVSDDVVVDTVLVNVTYPNGTITQISLSFASGEQYNSSFSAPALAGVYNITFFANDTSGNINNTETSNFTVADVVFPSVSIVTPLTSSNFLQNASVLITVSVSDDVNISQVRTNITLPNSSVIQNNLTYNDIDGVYFITFNETQSVGSYNLIVIANDTSNNINNTVSRLFNVQDNSIPLVALVSPSNASSLNINNITFICNATDASAISNITLYHNISGVFAQNQTNLVGGLTNETNFTINGISDGRYLWNCRAFDTSGNPAFASTNFTFSVDTQEPTVTNLLPAAGTNFNTSNLVSIEANVSDAFLVDTVLANITYPNGSVNQLSLNDSDSDGVYNSSFTAPNLTGTYTLLIIANDSINNINNTQTSNFSVNDANSLALSALGCNPANANLSQIVVCNSTATDDIGVDTIQANVTLPNGSVLLQTVGNSGSNYFFNFTNTNQVIGQYNVSWWGNDTSNNEQTATSNFNVSDRNQPTVTLSGPVDNYNSSSPNISFNFTPIDDFSTTLNCSLLLNGSINQTNSSIVNSTVTQFEAIGLAQGIHNWSIVCYDSSTNQNTSLVRNITIDTSAPAFISLSTDPSSVDDLDPGVNITVSANVTENLTSISGVLLQRKLTNDTIYINHSMVLNASSGLYSASFNATQNGTYNLRLIANDTVNNEDTSTVVNVTVQLDRTWTITPSTFAPILSNSSTNVSIGNFTINNTGDSTLNFTVSSDSNETIFNQTTNFSLSANSSTIFEVNDTSSSGGVKYISLSVNATPDASPSSRSASATIVSVPGQPVLSASFVSPSVDSISVTQGDINVVFSVKLENIGEGNASNITFFVNLPNDWIVTFGDTNISLDELLSGDNEENLIEVSIPSNASVGVQTVSVNATGINLSGQSLHDVGLIFSDTVNVTVASSSGGIASSAGSGGGGGGGSPSPSTTPSNSGGGSKGERMSKLIEPTLLREEILHSSETIELVRGQSDSFPIIVKNIFENTVVNKVSLLVDGFLPEHVDISPDLLYNIQFGEFKEFNLTLRSPDYLEAGSHELTIIIRGEINGQGINKDFVETRKILLIIHSIGESEALIFLEEARHQVEELQDVGLTSMRISSLLQQADQAFEDHNYDAIKRLAQEISRTKQVALQAQKLISDLEAKQEGNGITGASIFNFKGTQQLLGLARAAFAREDYETALERAKSAQLSLALQSKEVDLILFILNYWWLVLLGCLFIGTVGVVAYQAQTKATIKQRIDDLQVEEENQRGHIKDLQKAYYKNKKIGPATFHSAIAQHEKRLAKIHQKRTQLRHKRLHLLKPKKVLSDLDEERLSIMNDIKSLQTERFTNGKITQEQYKEEEKVLHLRLAQIEGEHMKLMKRMAKKK